MRSLNAELHARLRALRATGEHRQARGLVRDATETLGRDGPSLALADALVELGRREEDLGEYARATAAYERAEAGAAPLPRGDSVVATALGRRAALAAFLGSPAEAGRLADLALARAEPALVNDGQAMVEVLVAVALVRDDAGDAGAMALLHRAMLIAKTIDDDSLRDEALATTWQAIGTAHGTRGNLDQAKEALGTALTLAEGAFGPASPEVAGILNDLGMTAKYAGQFEEGEAAYLRAAAILERVGGPEHPGLASLLHNLGGLAHARRDFTAAEPPARRGLALSERLYGTDHPLVVRDRAALASILDGLGRSDEAETILREVIEQLSTSLGPDHHEVAANLNNLAAIVARRGDLDEAQALYGRALEIKERTVGPTSPSIAISLNNLATVARRQSRVGDAETLYRRALAILEASVEPTHPNLLATRRNLAIVLRAAGRAPEAIELEGAPGADVTGVAKATGAT